MCRPGQGGGVKRRATTRAQSLADIVDLYSGRTVNDQRGVEADLSRVQQGCCRHRTSSAHPEPAFIPIIPSAYMAFGTRPALSPDHCPSDRAQLIPATQSTSPRLTWIRRHIPHNCDPEMRATSDTSLSISFTSMRPASAFLTFRSNSFFNRPVLSSSSSV